MAEHTEHHDESVEDGRFGDRFDDELAPGVVVQVLVGIAFACALGMLITFFMVRKHAAWALGRIGGEDADAALIAALDADAVLDQDTEVVAELVRARARIAASRSGGDGGFSASQDG